MKRMKHAALLALTGVPALIFSGCASGTASALKAAIDGRSTDLAGVAELVKKEPDARLDDGRSCLFYAVKMERFAIAETMAANGARMTAGEAHILFDVEEKKTASARYRFMQPMFPSQMAKYADGVPAEEQKFYTCGAGASAEKIARELRCTTEALIAANPDVDFSHLRRGQKLLVPQRGK